MKVAERPSASADRRGVASSLAKKDPKNAKKLFEKADANHDGKVSLEELKAFLEKTDKNHAAKGNP